MSKHSWGFIISVFVEPQNRGILFNPDGYGDSVLCWLDDSQAIQIWCKEPMKNIQEKYEAFFNTDLMLMASVIGKCRFQEQVKQYFATTNPADPEN